MRLKAPTPILSRPVRICSIQYCFRPVADFDAFANQVEAYVDVGDDYDADIILFPELLTTQLVSCLPKNIEPAKVMRVLAETHTEKIDELFSKLSNEYDRIVVAGTHPRIINNNLFNVCGIYVPGHQPVYQAKMHLTPTERVTWQFQPGNSLEIVDTGFVHFATAICYDVQFPEIPRLLSKSGIQLLLVPYLTDDRRGYTRVTSCARARAIENQIYVVTAGMTGSLPMITDLTAQFAQSGMYTPSDFPFPMDGIATEAAPNSEMVIVADLDMALLDQARQRGTVHNYEDSVNDGINIQFDGQINIHKRHWMDL
ncbi:MAG: carbon-nitrogen hydrolase family protein [Holophagaceae bacterium]|nr:carbon-nitrogen hydrolase family protein [Holophagaceae bacterium]